MTGRRFHRTMEMIPARPWQSKSPSASTLIKQCTNKGTQGVQARYGTELPPFISIVQYVYPGRPVISVPEKKHIKNKTRKQKFHGIVPGFWGGDFVYVFSPPKGMTRRKKTHTHINTFLAPPPPQSRDNPANLFMFMCFFFP